MSVYLPVLLLLPDSFTWGWPPLSPHQYAIIPIGLVLIWYVVIGRWKVSLIDVVTFGFIGWTVVADFHANGLIDIADRVMTPITIAILPYMAGKLLIEQTGMRYAFARRFAFFLFIDAIISVYECRMAVNPFRSTLLNLFSAPVVDTWVTQLRYGLGRTAGPFGHAILMGSVISIAVLLHRYGMHVGVWEERFRWLPTFGIKKSWVILGVLILGSAMTLSRAPWIALVVGLIVASTGTSPDRWRALKRNIVVLAVAGGLIYFGGKAYVAASDVSGAGMYASNEDIASVEYRTQLVSEYRQIALTRSVWGWGSTSWPHVPGMVSVDNWYLLLSLMYGVTGTVLFALMMTVATARLLWVGMFDVNLDGAQRALLFTLGSILIAVAVALATVYLGSQLYPILFLILGWSDACLISRPERTDAAPSFAFRKVIA
jgi:hypothetical protein